MFLWLFFINTYFPSHIFQEITYFDFYSCKGFVHDCTSYYSGHSPRGIDCYFQSTLTKCKYLQYLHNELGVTKLFRHSMCMAMLAWLCICMAIHVWLCMYGYVCMHVCLAMYVWLCIYGYVCLVVVWPSG